MSVKKIKFHKTLDQGEENNIIRTKWDTEVLEDQDCWGACTAAGGFSCGYTLIRDKDNHLNPRSNSDKYQCAKSFLACQKWLDIPYRERLCPRPNCIPWVDRLNKIPIFC